MDLEKNCREFLEIKINKIPTRYFNLDYNKIKKLDSWGNLSVENLKFSINQKNISLEKFIYALGIRHIGLENAKLISNILRLS